MNVILMYGGKSCEHDISIITAKQVAHALPGSVFEVYVSREGKWFLAKKGTSAAVFADDGVTKNFKEVCFCVGDSTLYLKSGKKLKPLCNADVAVLCFHGANGEDGCVQGLLELCGVPYTSCGVAPSAVCMDKIVCKSALKGLGMPVLQGFGISSADDFEDVAAKARELGYPLMIKPAALGSSIGITLCRHEGQLASALQLAFKFDGRALAEKALTDFCDVNVSVFARDGEIFVSPAEKPLAAHEFLSFADKYQSGAKGMADAGGQFPFEDERVPEMQRAAKMIYSSLDCRGVVRIDFLLDNKSKKFFINEINTIPGSMAYYLWQDQFDFATLMRAQINEGIKAFKTQNSLLRHFASNVLKGGKGKKRR